MGRCKLFAVLLMVYLWAKQSQPHEVAGVAVILASKAGEFITGQNIIVVGETVISDGN